MAESESRWACPVCGAHRLAMEELPRVGAMGAQPYTDILGMGDPADRTMPAIVCLQCATRWPNADAFWAATNAAEESESVPLGGEVGGNEMADDPAGGDPMAGEPPGDATRDAGSSPR